jgi:hypothetical protein
VADLFKGEIKLAEKQLIIDLENRLADQHRQYQSHLQVLILEKTAYEKKAM